MSWYLYLRLHQEVQADKDDVEKLVITAVLRNDETVQKAVEKG